MIDFHRTGVYNIENAARGARNAFNSWDNMDSGPDSGGEFKLGPTDLALLMKLCAAGGSHGKFRRQIFVSVDITAPLYWWKEYDTYKVGTVANSQSTMHRLHAKPIVLEDFSHDKLSGPALKAMAALIETMEHLRKEFVKTKDKAHWYALIQLLPSSYRQMRTCTMNYENLVNMRRDRKNHRLDEWREFCDWADSLPYAKEFIAMD